MPIGIGALDGPGRLAERVVRREPALLHRRRGERGEADDVADRVDVRHVRPVVRVDADPVRGRRR